MVEVAAWKPIRVLFVTPGLDHGGAEHALVSLATRLHAHRFESAVVSLLSGGPLRAELALAGIHVHEMGWKRSRVPLPTDWLALRRVGTAFPADLLVGWMYNGNVAATVLRGGMQPRPPMIWTIHHSAYGLESEKLRTRLLVRASSRISHKANRIIFVANRAARSHYELGFPRGDGAVIHNGVDTDRFRPDRSARAAVRGGLGLDHEFAVGFVGRWHPAKDIGNFLRAAAKVAQRSPGARFVVVGAGLSGANAELVGLARRYGLIDRLVLLGQRDDVPQIMNAIDVLVLSSQNEACPLVVGEAMACGTPVVATDVGDVAEILGGTGLVVPPRDPDRLADAVARMAGLPDSARQSLGAAARERVQARFALPVVVAEYIKHFQEVLARGRPRVQPSDGP